MEKDSLKLAESVRRLRRSGMPQREVASRLQISQSTVSRLEKYEPAQESGSLAMMVAAEDKRRAIRDEIYEAYNDGDMERVNVLWREEQSI